VSGSAAKPRWRIVRWRTHLEEFGRSLLSGVARCPIVVGASRAFLRVRRNSGGAARCRLWPGRCYRWAEDPIRRGRGPGGQCSPRNAAGSFSTTETPEYLLMRVVAWEAHAAANRSLSNGLLARNIAGIARDRLVSPLRPAQHTVRRSDADRPEPRNMLPQPSYPRTCWARPRNRRVTRKPKGLAGRTARGAESDRSAAAAKSEQFIAAVLERGRPNAFIVHRRRRRPIHLANEPCEKPVRLPRAPSFIGPIPLTVLVAGEIDLQVHPASAVSFHRCARPCARGALAASGMAGARMVRFFPVDSAMSPVPGCGTAWGPGLPFSVRDVRVANSEIEPEGGQAQSRRATRMKSRVSWANMSHEIRTP